MKLLCFIRHRWKNGVVIVRRPNIEQTDTGFVTVSDREAALLARRCTRCGLHEVESIKLKQWCVLHQIERFVDLPERAR